MHDTGFIAKAYLQYRVWGKFCLFFTKKDKFTKLQNTLDRPTSVQFFILSNQQNPHWAHFQDFIKTKSKITCLHLLQFSASPLFKMNKSQLKTIQKSKSCTMYEEYNKKKLKSIHIFKIPPIELIVHVHTISHSGQVSSRWLYIYWLDQKLCSHIFFNIYTFLCS